MVQCFLDFSSRTYARTHLVMLSRTSTNPPEPCHMAGAQASCLQCPCSLTPCAAEHRGVISHRAKNPFPWMPETWISLWHAVQVLILLLVVMKYPPYRQTPITYTSITLIIPRGAEPSDKQAMRAPPHANHAWDWFKRHKKGPKPRRQLLATYPGTRGGSDTRGIWRTVHPDPPPLN